MRKKIAFYPCCASDIDAPRRLLSSFVDLIVFCDIRPELVELVRRIEESPTASDWPQIRSITGDAVEALDNLGKINVLFYRRDSDGEGGSGVYVLGDGYMRRLLPHFPSEGGLIITDGSNERGAWFRKMKRKSGLTKYGWHIRAADEQLLENEGLTIFNISKIQESI